MLFNSFYFKEYSLLFIKMTPFSHYSQGVNKEFLKIKFDENVRGNK